MWFIHYSIEPVCREAHRGFKENQYIIYINMYTEEQFEKAIDELAERTGKEIRLVEVKMVRGKKVRVMIGKVDGKRVEWNAFGEASNYKGVLRELNLKFDSHAS